VVVTRRVVSLRTMVGDNGRVVSLRTMGGAYTTLRTMGGAPWCVYATLRYVGR